MRRNEMRDEHAEALRISVQAREVFAGPRGPIFPDRIGQRLCSSLVILRWQRNDSCLQHLYLHQSAITAIFHLWRGTPSPRLTMPSMMSLSSAYSPP